MTTAKPHEHHAHAPEPKLEKPEGITPATATSIPQATQDSINAILQEISNDFILRGAANGSSHLKVLAHQTNVKNTLKNANF